MSELLRHLLFLPRAGSTLADRVDGIHFFIIIITFIVAVCIGLTGFVFLVRFRRQQAFAMTPHVQAPMWLEGLFIGVPLSFFLLWGVMGFRDFVWAKNPPAGALDVYVTGKQWMWKFAYPDGIGSVGELYVPMNKPVRVLITSRDVVHSFYVPEFRLKQDALPGRYTEMWFQVKRPGRYQVLCAEYCGLDHSHMRAEVVALEPGDFEAWRARQKSLPEPGPGEEPLVVSGADAPGPLAELGRAVATRKGCFQCHTVDGTPHIGPTWLGLYQREESLQSGERIRADVAYLTESMMDPAAKVVAGFNPVMPNFQGRLSPQEVAAIVEFIKSLRPERPVPPAAQEPTYVPVRR
ncbi:MAG TPA: cytochrome c oxidase subunit II [Hyalangium sp.]|jgi:cytochrome c oxidase subunit 2|nr:cytochrome c oxidase subunit II [Hyalangium sp.]